MAREPERLSPRLWASGTPGLGRDCPPGTSPTRLITNHPGTGSRENREVAGQRLCPPVRVCLPHPPLVPLPCTRQQLETEKKRRETVEREKEQMLREKEELMLRLQDYEQKTKRAEKGQQLRLPCPPPPRPPNHPGVGPQPRGDPVKSTVCLTQTPPPK